MDDLFFASIRTRDSLPGEHLSYIFAPNYNTHQAQAISRGQSAWSASDIGMTVKKKMWSHAPFNYCLPFVPPDLSSLFFTQAGRYFVHVVLPSLLQNSCVHSSTEGWHDFSFPAQTASLASPSRRYRCPCGGQLSRDQRWKQEVYAMHLLRFRLKMQCTC